MTKGPTKQKVKEGGAEKRKRRLKVGNSRVAIKRGGSGH